jgi:hypothetical protein
MKQALFRDGSFERYAHALALSSERKRKRKREVH